MRAEYDVIVVGSRIAGATLAALLGDAGASHGLLPFRETVELAADLRGLAPTP